MNKYELDIIVVPGPENLVLSSGELYYGGIKFVEIQKELFNIQNKSVKIRWNLGILSEKDDNVKSPELDRDTRIFSYRKDHLNVKYIEQPSSQHGGILNNLLRDLTKDHYQHVLIIDPDYFVFKDDWIIDLISYMSSQNLSMLGAAYPEIDPRFYFDFPTAYFTLIDTSKIELKKLDYRPDEKQFVVREDEPWGYGFSMSIGNYKAMKAELLMRYSFTFSLVSFFLWRNKKNFFRDTGWNVRKKYKRKCKHEEFLYVSHSDLKNPNVFKLGNKKTKKNDFDAKWYLDTYEDVKKSNLDPREHYMKYGRFEGRLPNANYNYVKQLRPHLEFNLLSYAEKLISNEYSIIYRRSYSMLDFLREYESKFTLFEEIPPAAAYYFFKEGFFSVHLGHYSKTKVPEEFKKEIFQIYLRAKSCN
jgi:hypothetical protein